MIATYDLFTFTSTISLFCQKQQLHTTLYWKIKLYQADL